MFKAVKNVEQYLLLARKQSYLAAFYIILMTVNLYSQEHNIRFYHISIEEGLSQSMANCVYQDSKGFMWFGTQDGLNKYDGYNFTIYSHDQADSTSLGDKHIRTIYEDKSGILWIGTWAGGLNQYNRNLNNFTRYQYDQNNPNSLSSNYVQCIIEDKSGRFWLGTRGGGLNLFDRNTNTFSRYLFDPDNQNSISSNNLSSLYEDHLGFLWIGTEGGGLNRFDPTEQNFIRYQKNSKNRNSISNNYVQSICEDHMGNLWIGTQGGLNQFNRSKESFTCYKHIPGDPNSLSTNNVSSVYIDRNGKFWIGTNGGGINLLNPVTKRFTNYQNDPYDRYSLNHNDVLSIYEDRSGTIWVSTWSGGLNWFESSIKGFTTLRNDPNNPGSLSYNEIWTIYEDPDKTGKELWIGTRGGGLNRFDRSKNHFTHYKHDPSNPNSLSDNHVYSILKDHQGMFWIGTGNGLDRLILPADPIGDASDHTASYFRHYKHNPDNPNSISAKRINVIHEDNSKSLWLGTEGGGLNLYNRKTKQFIRYQNDPDNPNSLSNNSVRSIYEDNLNVLWIGTLNGLDQFDRTTQKFKQYYHDAQDPYSISNDKILSICEDPKNNLWIATTDGLNKFDRSTEQFTRLTTKDGLPNNLIYAILVDNDGILWISTNRGLSMLDPETRKLKNFDVTDGLQSNEFNAGACFKSTKSGEVFFGGINGFNAFHPENIKGNTYIPPVVISDFQIFNKSIAIGKEQDGRIILKKSITETEEIELSYKEQIFSFEFASLNYIFPEKNEYAYKMENFEEEWNFVGNRRFATYTNLPPGDYTFRVKGSNNDGVWNEEGVSLRIVIIPPFWETKWFISLMVIFLAASIYAGYRLRVRSITAQREMLRVEVAKKTQQLKVRNKKLNAAKKETDNILQNVKEGLFLLDQEYKIESQYSAALEKILSEQQLAKISFTNYLQEKVDKKTVDSVHDYLEILFDNEIDEDTLGQLNPLSQIEFNLNGDGSKFLTFDFRRINENNKTVQIISTVNDVTEKIRLEKDLEETREENKRKMDWLLCIMNVEPVMLQEFVQSAHDELSHAESALKGIEQKEPTSEILEDVYRSVHTVKGNASMLELDFFADRAHQVEDKIAELKDKDRISSKDTSELYSLIEMIQNVYNEMKGLIEQIKQIHDQFRPKRSHEHNLLIKSLTKLVDNLGKEYKKQIKLITDNFKGENIPYKHRLLIRDILVQLIRNSMFHGIEIEAERKEKGKKTSGTIEIENYMSNGDFILKLKDDGRGLNIDKLRQKAKELRKWESNEIDTWTEKQVSEIIFESGISTAEKTDMTAGRGVGMDIIANKIKQYKGKIEVNFKEGEYCKFHVILPIE